MARLTAEWQAVIRRDRSHPCVIAWVPFNESWGVPDLPDSPAQRHYVQALYHLTKTLDPTRPVVGNDGWESVATDVIGIHDYDDRLAEIARRYGADEAVARLFRKERPGGRMLILGNSEAQTTHPVVLTEFGGIAYSPEDRTWGYSRASLAGRPGRPVHPAVGRGAVAAGAGRVLLHPVRRHLPGGERPAVRRPHAQVPASRHRPRHPRADHCAQEYEAERLWREDLMRAQRKPPTDG